MPLWWHFKDLDASDNHEAAQDIGRGNSVLEESRLRPLQLRLLPEVDVPIRYRGPYPVKQ